MHALRRRPRLPKRAARAARRGARLNGPLELDPLAARGFADSADRYERGRPSYPDDAVALAFDQLALGDASTVVDVGAGTGKLTRALARRAGAVIAVDPSPRMLDKLREGLPAVRAFEGTAEGMPLPDASVDGAFVGDAFHWFRGDEALAEIGRVVRPGGGLVLMWHARRPEGWEVPWAQELGTILAEHHADGVRPENRYESGRWREAFERTPLFGPLASFSVQQVQRLDTDGFIAQVGSWSFVAALDSAERSEALEKLRAVLRRHGAETIEIPYRTDVYWARRG